MAFSVYPSDLNHDEWALLDMSGASSKPYDRRRSSDMRRIGNGACYVLHCRPTSAAAELVNAQHP
jgi:hypothetical protein